MSNTVRLASFAMGTRFEVVLVGGDPRRLQAAGEATLEEIDDWDRRLSRFRRDSFLNHIHRCASFGPVMLDDDTFELFEECERVRRASDGAFDINVGAFMSARGVGAVAEALVEPLLERRPPAAGALELDRRHGTIRFARQGVSLDLGGVGKGHALDLAARLLRDAGVETALLHGGTSTSVAIGAPPGLTGWRVAVEGGERAPVFELRDCALSVSASHGRPLHDRAGTRIAHVVDPRIGRSVAMDRIAVVLAPSARTADAWSTALLVGQELASDLENVSAWVGAGPPDERQWRALGAPATDPFPAAAAAPRAEHEPTRST